MPNLYQEMLDELSAVFSRIDEQSVDMAVDEIARASRIALYGVGREGLQIKGFAMRLYHLGLKVSVVGDMNSTPLREGDLLIASAGPGYFSTVAALMNQATTSGARTLLVTATPGGICSKAAHLTLPIPAAITQDNSTPDTSIMPMGGSLYEGALYVLFEAMILKLRNKLGVDTDAMRKNHTNLE